jgi:metal-responsive CopG/Arc/MetJ family transcriptional regulator
MAKPKPSVETERINFSLPKKLKEEWRDFAKDELYCSISQMIRMAVEAYRLRYAELKSPKEITGTDYKIMKMEEQQREIWEFQKKIAELLESKPKENSSTNIAELTGCIIGILKDNQPMDIDKIALYSRLTRDEVVEIITPLQLGGEVEKVEGGYKLTYEPSL